MCVFVFEEKVSAYLCVYYKKRNISGGSTWVLSGVGVRIKCKIKYPSITKEISL